MKVRKEEPAKKMLDFEWESSEVATVNAVREVVAPGSGKFPATNHPTHSSSLSCSNETSKLLKCSPTTSTIAPQSSRAVPSFVSGVSSQSTKWVLGLGSLTAAFSAKDAQCAEFFCFPSMKLCKKFGTLLEILHSAQCHKRERCLHETTLNAHRVGLRLNHWLPLSCIALICIFVHLCDRSVLLYRSLQNSGRVVTEKPAVPVSPPWCPNQPIRMIITPPI